MEWGYAFIAGLFILGVVLAFPVAIGICAALGGVLMAVDRLTTRCPGCGQRRMVQTNGIRETYPTGRGTGRFYLCRACGGRWFWSNDDRAWQDASSPDYAWAFIVGEQRHAEPGAAADGGACRLSGTCRSLMPRRQVSWVVRRRRAVLPMSFRTPLAVFAHDRPFMLIVEPWAEEFAIAVGDRCEVVALHPAAPPTFGAEVVRSGDLMVWVNESGATYEFWRGGVLEFHTPVAIPHLPPPASPVG